MGGYHPKEFQSIRRVEMWVINETRKVRKREYGVGYNVPSLILSNGTIYKDFTASDAEVSVIRLEI